MPLDRDTLTAQELSEFLNTELPGFANRLFVEDRQGLVVIQVRGAVHFNGEIKFDSFSYPIPFEARYIDDVAAEVAVDHAVALIRRTRDHAIDQLGLRTEMKQQIEQQVAERVAQAQREWEQKGWERGYAAAYATAAKNIAESLDDGLNEEESEE